MSRTFKDMPWKLRFPQYDEYEKHEYWAEGVSYWKQIPYSGIRHFSVKKAGVKPKQKKTKDTEYRWMNTPGWWTSMFMNQPQRYKGRQWEKQIVREDLGKVVNDYFDTPSVSRKPHLYFW